ncbi:MAG: hypothetical protein EOM12_12255 [Verrucomicrobiae bacterium]|nr:hypothetical protein [Verrucomicrobiae bacterium]
MKLRQVRSREAVVSNCNKSGRAIGKHRQAVGKQLVEAEGQVRGICGDATAANSRHLSLENLLASHRGEFA